MSQVPTDRSSEEGEILEEPAIQYYYAKAGSVTFEVRPEESSYAPTSRSPLSDISQNTTSSRKRLKRTLYKVRSSSNDKRAAGRRAKNRSLVVTDPDISHEAPSSPCSAYQDPYNAYVLLDYLGKGGEGACLLIQRKIDQQLRVCKISTRSKHDNTVPNEVKILRDILPPNDRIIKFYGLTLTPQTSQIYMDFHDGGDLSNLIDNHYLENHRIPESFIWHALLHLAEAVAFLHYGFDRNSLRPSQRNWTKVIHRDIKPENILLRRPKYNFINRAYNYPSLVLADFGLATLKSTSSLVGTYVWQPPEIPKASLAGDCWSVGAVIHAIALEGCPPIDMLPPKYTRNTENHECWAMSSRSRKAWPIRQWYTRELEESMLGALTHDPWKRFNALQILNTAIEHYENTNIAWEPLGSRAYDSY